MIKLLWNLQLNNLVTGRSWIQWGRLIRTPGPFFFFIFMQFSAKILPNNKLAPLSLGLAHPLWEILDAPLQTAVFYHPPNFLKSFKIDIFSLRVTITYSF